MENKSLITKDLFFILNFIEQHGQEARLVGGAVRNFLLGIEISDIDIATTATPEEIINIFQENSITVVPIGVDFGTVMILSNGKSYEITTLREDIQTFGRKAKVAFTKSFELDSKRRDFTINAIYMDKNGTIFDYNDGIQDISLKNIRFIGDARTRIAEDYLRILRYFRFVAYYGEYKFNQDYLNIIDSLKKNMSILSSERVLNECLKIFKLDDSYKIIPSMRAVLDELFDLRCDPMEICVKLDIFGEMSSLDRVCMLLKFSNLSLHKEKRYNFPKNIREMLKLEPVHAELVDVKQKLKIINKKYRSFYIKFVVTLAYFNKSLTEIEGKQLISQLNSFIDSEYVDFKLKAKDITDQNLSKEDLKKVMIATKEFWIKAKADLSISDCIKFAQDYLKTRCCVK